MSGLVYVRRDYAERPLREGGGGGVGGDGTQLFEPSAAELLPPRVRENFEHVLRGGRVGLGRMKAKSRQRAAAKPAAVETEEAETFQEEELESFFG